MDYPLYVKFRVLFTQFSVYDAYGNHICFVKKEFFKLKEIINVYKEREMQTILFSIHADRVIDFSALYTFFDHNEQEIGSIKRHGKKSIWRANFDIYLDEDRIITINEDNVAKRFLNIIVSQFLLGGLLFHPSYTFTRDDGTPVYKVSKQTSFFGNKFKIELLEDMTEKDEMKILLGTFMLLVLERPRG